MQFQLKTMLMAVSSVTMLLAATGCATMDMGSSKAKTEATGSAGGGTAVNANATLEKCDKPLGTLAVVEDTNADWYRQLTGQYHLGPTTPVLKLLVQQSNCFVVVDRGAAMALGNGERNLRDSGEMRETSNFKKGQMVAADYAMNPTITFSSNDTGGVGAGLGGWGGGWLGLLAGGLKFADASTMLTLVDNRSSVQVAAAEGSARNTDFSLFGGAFGSRMGAAGGGYTKTPEGKVVVAAFTDSYNNLVKAVKNYKTQTVEGGLGAGGNLAVQAEEPVQKATTPTKTTTTKKKKVKK